MRGDRVNRIDFYAEYRRRVDAVLSELQAIEAWWQELDLKGEFDDTGISARTNESQDTDTPTIDGD